MKLDAYYKTASTGNFYSISISYNADTRLQLIEYNPLAKKEDDLCS